MDKAFTSPRLTYRAFEDSDEHKNFFHKSIQSDPTNFAQSDISLFRPQSLKASNESFTNISKALLAVMIYITPDTNSSTSKGEEQKQDIDVKEEKDTVEKKEDVPIGFFCLANTFGPTNNHHRTCTLGIAIASPYHNRGYGSEAINWALDWAFRFGNIHSVGLACFSFNTGAERLYERLGFVREGRLRERIWWDRKWYDEILFGMTEGDWMKLRGIDT
jgi:RimJ/RimL family protein N-acetyltransferase